MRCGMRTWVVGAMLAAAHVTGLGAQVPTGSLVTAEGEAIVRRAPDRAWLTMATETREARAADARRRAAEGMTALQDALRKTGLPADAIRTSAFNLTPEMSWNNGRGTVRGYVVRNQIEVRVDQLDRLSDVIEAANSSPSTTISVSGPRFDLRDRAAADSEALRQAVQVALGRARAMASGAERSLGAIIRIEDRAEGGGSPEPMLMRAVAMKADAIETPIVAGDIETRASVRVTVELR
jgi:uncharacterized protein YggE